MVKFLLVIILMPFAALSFAFSYYVLTEQLLKSKPHETPRVDTSGLSNAQAYFERCKDVKAAEDFVMESAKIRLQSADQPRLRSGIPFVDIVGVCTFSAYGWFDYTDYAGQKWRGVLSARFAPHPDKRTEWLVERFDSPLKPHLAPLN